MRVLAPLVALAALAATLASPALSPAQADDSVPTITFRTDPTLPALIPLATDSSTGSAGDEAKPVYLTLHASTKDAQVQVTVSNPGGGLEVDPTTQTVDADVASGGGYDGSFHVVVDATSPGFHTLTYTAQVPGGDPVTFTQRFLWTPGGPPIAGTDSLAGHRYRFSGAEGDDECECTTYYTSEITFLDATHVRLGPFPRAEHPVCDRSCTTYEYDATTGLVQIGSDVIGSVTRRRGYFVNDTPGDPDAPDEPYGAARFQAFAAPGVTRLGHTWRAEPRKYADDASPIQLRLSHTGRYRLRIRLHVHGRHVLRYAGRYVLHPGGLLELHGAPHHGRVLRATLESGADFDGTVDPAHDGIVLRLTVLHVLPHGWSLPLDEYLPLDRT